MNLKWVVTQNGFSLDGTPFDIEDQTWFGVGGVLLILPALFTFVFAAVKKKGLLSFLLILFGISFRIFEIFNQLRKIITTNG